MAAKAVRIENNSIKKRVSFIKKKYFSFENRIFFFAQKKFYWKKGKTLITKTIFNFNH